MFALRCAGVSVSTILLFPYRAVGSVKTGVTAAPAAEQQHLWYRSQMPLPSLNCDRQNARLRRGKDSSMHHIPVVDLFAGPGGLSEGFHAFRNQEVRFSIEISIEKEAFAHSTLLLRSFFREFEEGKAPDAYYQYVSGRGVSRKDLFAAFPQEAQRAERKARRLTLGASTEAIAETDGLVAEAIGKADDWVLLGGPPCQAYSVAGRARHSRVDRDVFESDHRHLLYREYLRILARFRPAVFVMENVKGLLTAKFQQEPIFRRILKDLEAPADAMGLNADVNLGPRYHICSFVVPRLDPRLLSASDFLIRADRFGIPQHRERVILLGIRADVSSPPVPEVLEPMSAPTAGAVLGDLPALRSALSREPDSYESWRARVAEAAEIVLEQDRVRVWPKLCGSLEKIRDNPDLPQSTGGRFIEGRPSPEALVDWYVDPRLGGFLNHEARSHMASDLARYLFVSCFGKTFGRSPSLHDFPQVLHPDHQNVRGTLDRTSGGFSDRFKVQLEEQPSSTVVSHIAKDGHYYIHYDPRQCRALTVREAARLQTFPDNYFFEGNRTEQYTQVGNAVPPLLAHRLARVVAAILQGRQVEAAHPEEQAAE
jgi:DNA (cytosine-5)-methyltransferase 1